MTPEQKAAYIMAMAAEAMIEAMGMQAENQNREYRGQAPAYGEGDFIKMLRMKKIDHDSIMEVLR